MSINEYDSAIGDLRRSISKLPNSELVVRGYIMYRDTNLNPLLAPMRLSFLSTLICPATSEKDISGPLNTQLHPFGRQDKRVSLDI